MTSDQNSSNSSAARRKSAKPGLMVKLTLSPKLLQRFEPKIVKEESPSKDSSSSVSNTLPVTTSSNEDKSPGSKSNTPNAVDTPDAASSMPPPTEGVKKKGVKRTSAVALEGDATPNATPKPRGKPGPKKKARLEDGTIDPTSTATTSNRSGNTTGAHKLGPKANQGAINAGLRALDRSGKPCRKWAKGGFKLKSFTGVIWEIPRWTAPPRAIIRADADSSGSNNGSSKENKENSQVDSEKSNNTPAAIEKQSPASQNVSSPAPVPVPTPTVPTTA